MPWFWMTYSKALVIKPPLHPKFPYFCEQSKRFCELRDVRRPVVFFSCPSRAPTALKAQQEPQGPWKDRKLVTSHSSYV